MINVFRNIRRQLANENKFSKYMRYAFGEVLLIMLGIFMALQLQNWNEKRKQKQNFNTVLEQIYNALHYDLQKFESEKQVYIANIDTINKLLKHPNSIPSNRLPFLLFYIDFEDINDYTSEVSFHIENLHFSDDNIKQNELLKQITNYVKELNRKIEFDHKDVNNLFDELHLPWPQFNNDIFTSNINWNDSTYYANSNIKALEEYKQTEAFKAILTKIKYANVIYKGISFTRYKYTESLIQQIKTYYPEVKFIFTDVGIIGTSLDGFDDVGGTSTPMTLTNSETNTWETTLYLKQGLVKFRCNDSWFKNWGANDFPKGFGFQDGPDILVPEAGNYHIIFKPETGEYQFIKQDD